MGIDNVHKADARTFQPPSELEKRLAALVAATNVDLNDDGWPASRLPTAAVAALTTGLGGFSGAGLLLVQDAGDIVSIDPSTGTPTVVVTGLDAADPVRFHEHDGQVWWCNNEFCGRIAAGGVSANWGMYVPPTPTLGTTAGDLPAGIYQVAATCVDSYGIESGANKAASIVLNGSQDITATLAVTDPNAVEVRFYVAPIDSKGQGSLFWAKTVAVADLPTTISDAFVSTYPLKTQFMRGPIPGRGIASFNQLLLTWRDNWIYFSSGWSPHVFQTNRDVFRLPSNVQAVGGLAPCLWIATERGMWVTVGETLATMRLIQVDSEPYAQGCVVMPGYTVPSLQTNGRIALFVNRWGLAVGLPTGQLGYVSRHRYDVGSVVGKKASFAYVERDDLAQFVVTLSDAVVEGPTYWPPENPYNVGIFPPRTDDEWQDLLARLEVAEAHALPAGIVGDILIYDGTSWTATDELPL